MIWRYQAQDDRQTATRITQKKKVNRSRYSPGVPDKPIALSSIDVDPQAVEQREIPRGSGPPRPGPAAGYPQQAVRHIGAVDDPVHGKEESPSSITQRKT
jgi:hypothetical protein